MPAGVQSLLRDPKPYLCTQAKENQHPAMIVPRRPSGRIAPTRAFNLFAVQWLRVAEVSRQRFTIG